MNTLILLTDIIEKAILVLLLGLSIWSIAIIIDRRRYFKKQLAQDNADGFYARATQTFKQASAFQVDRAYSGFVKDQRQHLEKGLSVLATLGANTPFIGLFGTVLGIIRAMAYLGNQAGSGSVMSGVSQALYATALGLFVAVPAVISFNHFSHQIRQALQKTSALKDNYIIQNNLKQA